MLKYFVAFLDELILFSLSIKQNYSCDVCYILYLSLTAIWLLLGAFYRPGFEANE